MPLCGKRIRAVEELILAVTKGIWRMQLSHVDPVRFARFDDPNLVSAAGLVPTLALAHRAALGELAAHHLTVPGGAGCAAGAKVSGAGMVAGADSINDMDLLRHGAMGRLFSGVRAPSTLGTFLRGFRFGPVRNRAATASDRLSVHRRQARPENPSGKPSRSAAHPHPHVRDANQRSTMPARQGARWIQAKCPHSWLRTSRLSQVVSRDQPGPAFGARPTGQSSRVPPAAAVTSVGM